MAQKKTKRQSVIYWTDACKEKAVPYTVVLGWNETGYELCYWVPELDEWLVGEYEDRLVFDCEYWMPLPGEPWRGRVIAHFGPAPA